MQLVQLGHVYLTGLGLTLKVSFCSGQQNSCDSLVTHGRIHVSASLEPRDSVTLQLAAKELSRG